MSAQVLVMRENLTLDEAERLFIRSRHNRGGRGGPVSPDTLATYRTRLGLFIRWTAERGISRIGECRREDLEEYMLHVRDRRDLRAKNSKGRKLAPETVLDYYVGMKTFFDWLHEEGHISQDPTVKLKRPQVPTNRVTRTLTEAEQSEFLHLWTVRDAPDGYNALYMGEKRRRFIASRNRAISYLKLDNGIRRRELLCADAFDIRHDGVKWELILHEKGGGEGRVPLNGTVLQALNMYLRERRAYLGLAEREGPLFLLHDGRPMTRAALRNMFKTVKAKVMPKASPHLIRHTTAAEAWRGSGNVEYVRALLRHRHLNTTERYLRSLGADDVARINRTASPVERLIRGR